MNKLDSSQTEQLKEIVAYLQKKRREKSLSLEQIASSTFIRLHMLEALEAAQVEKLPELIYVRGFIRRYAEVLQLDGDRLAQQLTPAPSKVVVNSEDLTPKSETASSDSATIASLKHYWFYIPLVGIALSGTSYIIFRPPTPQRVTETPQQEKTDSTKSPPAAKASTPKPPGETTAAVEPYPTPAETTTQAPGETTAEEVPTPLSITVALKARSWLRIEVDGKREYEGILEEGEQKSWRARETLKIRAGNAGAVSYSLNQQPAQSLGQLGEVKEITLTPE